MSTFFSNSLTNILSGARAKLTDARSVSEVAPETSVLGRLITTDMCGSFYLFQGDGARLLEAMVKPNRDKDVPCDASEGDDDGCSDGEDGPTTDFEGRGDDPLDDEDDDDGGPGQEVQDGHEGGTGSGDDHE
jgi:hypothetical protein